MFNNANEEFKMKVNGMRWVILSLTVFITAINILDRGTLNYMWQDGKDKSTGVVVQRGIASELHIVSDDMPPDKRQQKAKEVFALINIAFMLAYGLSQLISGAIYDRLGTRKGFSISALIWGGAIALTSLVTGVRQLAFFRIMLGLGEAGPWPGTTKSNAEWFPVKERAIAQGFFGAASSLGNILVPVIIPVLFLTIGWRYTFVVLGLVCLVWVPLWYFINKSSPKNHPWVTQYEKDYILHGQGKVEKVENKILSIGKLLSDKRSYSVVVSRFFLDPVWWMFMTWLPIYLQEVYKLNIQDVAAVAWIPFVGAALGSLTGGWWAGKLIGKGHSAIKARKITIAIGGAIIVPGMIGAAFAPTGLAASLMLMFILGGFQFAITNIQTLPSDFHSGKTVGTLAGMGGASAVLGIIISTYLVPILTRGGNWMPFFAMGLLLIPLSIISVLIFSPKNEKVILNYE
jgi:MFS transporter, ACS family, hexuronate transporter